jgi:hypothetical protein
MSIKAPRYYVEKAAFTAPGKTASFLMQDVDLLRMMQVQWKERPRICEGHFV